MASSSAPASSTSFASSNSTSPAAELPAPVPARPEYVWPSVDISAPKIRKEELEMLLGDIREALRMGEKWGSRSIIKTYKQTILELEALIAKESEPSDMQVDRAIEPSTP